MTDHALRPRKRFGQHFLRDAQVLRRIVTAIAPRPGQRLVEIGPGRGALTDLLLNGGAKLVAIEIDRDLAALLRARYAGRPDFTLIEGDALNFDYRQLAGAGPPLRLVGNLPYNLSTPLLFALLGHRQIIVDMVFMLQKEVVERLAATAGTKAYGRLSVMVQYHCQVEPLFTVPPSAFLPPPKVDSAVVRLIPRTEPQPAALDLDHFAQLVSPCSQQRRKPPRNPLKPGRRDPARGGLRVPGGARPDTLSVADFVALSNHLLRSGAGAKGIEPGTAPEGENADGLVRRR